MPRRRRRPRIATPSESDGSGDGDDNEDSDDVIPVPPFVAVDSHSDQSGSVEEIVVEDETEESSSPYAEEVVVISGEKAEASGLGSAQEADSSVLPQCPVCYEPWAQSGPHRVCCIPCGHVYGRCCLEKWLSQFKSKTVKCPQCSRKFCQKDIINLYAPEIVVPNRDLEEQLHKLREKYETLETERKRLIDELRQQEERNLSYMQSFKKPKLGFKCKFCGLEDIILPEHPCEGEMSSIKASFYEATSMPFCNNGNIRFTLKNELLLDGARVMAIDAARSLVLVSSKAPRSGTEHILHKISMLAPQQSELIHVPPNTKAIKDLCFLQDGLAVVASLGKKLSFVSMRSNNVVLQYKLPAPAWSCTGDASSEYYVYAGLQNGMLQVFDIRQTAVPLHSIEGLSVNPIHTIHSTPYHSTPRKVFTASSLGPCLWDVEDTRTRPTLILENPGVCISLACATPDLDFAVASFRPRVEIPNSMVLTQTSGSPSTPFSSLPKVGYHALIRRALSTPCETEHVEYGNVSELRMSKSAIVQCCDGESFFTYGDERFRCVRIWQLPSFQKYTDLEQHQHPILDIRYAQGPSGERYLGCVSEEKLQLYSVL